jgi:hypothetical protein
MGETGMLESHAAIDIFEIRRQSAERNLDALDEFVESIKGRTAALRKLRAQLDHDRGEILDRLEKLKEHVLELGEKLNNDRIEKPDMKGPVEATERNFLLLQSAIIEVRKHWNSIPGLKLDPNADEMKNRDLALREQIKERKRKVQKLIATGDDVRKRWRDMDELKEFWAVSLDYLAGVSLRHDGLDLDICGIADDLICDLQASCPELGALTILGRDCCSTSLPRIVFLRFPEWTVWVLPLAAGELWRDVSRPIRTSGQGRAYASTISESYLSVVAERDLAKPDITKADQPIGKKKEESNLYQRWINKPLLTDCLTDIFGTFVLGPAYVLSSICLALDPTDDNDRMRAEIILHVIRILSSEAYSFPITANASLSAIEDAWNQAVREAGRSNGLTPEELKKREDQRADLARWRDSFLNYLRAFGTLGKLRFPFNDWEAGKEKWVQSFLSFNPAKDGSDASSNPARDSTNAPGTIRLALAAAWEARIRNPLKSRNIAQACKQVCEAIAARRLPNIPPEPPRDFFNSNR